MNKKLIKLNLVFTLLFQLVNLCTGLILPRLYLSTFGSEVNGLCSSIAQFLNYVQLLEGGLTGVTTAALYKPLAENDMHRVSSIIRAMEHFFRKLALIFLIYGIGVAVIYPLVVKSSFNFLYVFSLVIIIGAATFIEYFFALTLRILIQADQHNYIRYAVNIAFYLINLALVIISIHLWPSIHLVKLIGAFTFLLQPIYFTVYVKKHYPLDRSVEPDEKALSQRWDGFGQNLAFFIHSNTDIAVITIFSTLTNVSIYSVYFMVIGAVKTLVTSVSSAIYPSFGNVYAKGNKDELNTAFNNYELLMHLVAVFAFSCCIVLIRPFIAIYTAGINDADYSNYIFAIILCCAEAVYCMRDPFVSLSYCAGHFRQTAGYAYAEAGVNIALSVLLIRPLGLMGVAIGTLTGMALRMVMLVIYDKHHLIDRPIHKWFWNFILYVILGAVSIFLSSLVHIPVTDYLQWFYKAVITASITVCVLAAGTLLFQRKQLVSLYQQFFSHKD